MWTYLSWSLQIHQHMPLRRLNNKQRSWSTPNLDSLALSSTASKDKVYTILIIVSQILSRPSLFYNLSQVEFIGFGAHICKFFKWNNTQSIFYFKITLDYQSTHLIYDDCFITKQINWTQVFLHALVTYYLLHDFTWFIPFLLSKDWGQSQWGISQSFHMAIFWLQKTLILLCRTMMDWPIWIYT